MMLVLEMNVAIIYIHKYYELGLVAYCKMGFGGFAIKL